MESIESPGFLSSSRDCRGSRNPTIFRSFTLKFERKPLQKTEFADQSKMPNLRIETNVSKSAIKDLPGFLKELSSALAATTGKPEKYMVVQVGGVSSISCNWYLVKL